LFEDIFDEVVRKCIATGLVDGSLLLTDSTHVRANAANDKQEIITLTQEPSAYMKKLDELAVKDGFIEEVKPEPEAKTVERKQSLTDPDCGMMKRPGKPYGFHYLSHNTVDGKSGIITDVFVTAGNVTDSTVYTERIKYQINKFGFHTKEAGGDAGYDTREIQADMLDMGIQTYMPVRDARNQFTTFTVREFEYDAENDEYICPNNCRLRYYLYKRGSGVKCYKSDAKQCSACPYRSQCLSEKCKQKRVGRMYHETEYAKQHEINDTPRYQEVMMLRQIWCEGNFACQKSQHCLKRAKMRGLVKTTGQCLLSATVLNLKRLVAWVNTNLFGRSKYLLIRLHYIFIPDILAFHVSVN